VKGYLFALLFIAGNMLLPQLCHLVPNGGLMLLPIYFFTLIAAYKYGFWVGLLTALLSPLANCLLFGMPPVTALPAILIKSALLAGVAAYAAHRYGKLTIWILLGVVLLYQVLGTAFEWAIVQNFHDALQDFHDGLPGMLVQVVGGYFQLKGIAKY
jgi:hypothetical protein